MEYRLTPRQRRILELVMDNADMTDHQLGDLIGVSIPTIKKHKSDLYHIFGVRGKLGLVMKVIKEGLL